MQETNVVELRKRIKYFLDVVESGEIVRVYRNGKPIAEILPLTKREASWRREVPRLTVPGLSLSRELLKDRAEHDVNRVLRLTTGIGTPQGKLLKGHLLGPAVVTGEVFRQPGQEVLRQPTRRNNEKNPLAPCHSLLEGIRFPRSSGRLGDADRHGIVQEFLLQRRESRMGVSPHTVTFDGHSIGQPPEQLRRPPSTESAESHKGNNVPSATHARKARPLPRSAERGAQVYSLYAAAPCRFGAGQYGSPVHPGSLRRKDRSRPDRTRPPGIPAPLALPAYKRNL